MTERTFHPEPRWNWYQISESAPEGATRAVVACAAQHQCTLWMDDAFFGRGARRPQGIGGAQGSAPGMP